MKISYFMILAVFCSDLGSINVRADSVEAALAKEHINVIPATTYGKCSTDYYPSKYLDNIYHGVRCYKCAAGTAWNKSTHTCS